MIAQIQMRRGTTAEWAAASPVVLAAGEPGWDSTLEGMKVGDGSTEWAALPWIDAKNRPDINADTLDGVHLADIRLGQNILHNWDFRNPVNQRAISGTITTAGYFYDRWILNSGSVVTNAAYLTLGAGTEIEQRIEGNLLAGETVTVSVMVGGAVYSGTGIMPTSSGTASVTITGWGTATLGYATGYTYLRLSPTSASNVQAVKMELGTISTLHLDPPMDYAVELLKFQRFFLDLGQLPYGFGSVVDATNATLYFPLPVTMRTVPTLFGNTGACFMFTTSGVKAITGYGTPKLYGHNFSLPVISSGLTQYHPITGYLIGTSGSHIYLSSDL